MSYFSNIYQGIKTLLTGMSVTGKYFLHSRKGTITQQYPDNRETLKMFDRFRGEVIMPLSLIHISEPTRPSKSSRMPSSA